MNIKKITIVFGMISLFVFVLILSTLFVSFFTPLHKVFLEKDETIISNDKQITSFLISGDENKLPSMTYNEASHLKDVRRLLIIGFFVLFVSFRFTTSAWNNRLPKRTYRTKTSPPNYVERLAIVAGSFLTMATLSLSFLGENFTQQFIYFHEIFFPQGNYFFSETSVLISTYPETFFIMMGLSIFFISCIIFIILGCFCVRKIYKASNTHHN
jgi:uncharacterized membrane protein